MSAAPGRPKRRSPSPGEVVAERPEGSPVSAAPGRPKRRSPSPGEVVAERPEGSPVSAAPGRPKRRSLPPGGKGALPKPAALNLACSVLLVALIALCVLWEGWLAPLRPGGSWMMLKALPLVAALAGVVRGRRYTYQWLSMLVLLYLTEGVVRAGDAGLGGRLALAEAILSALLFVAVVLYARQTAPSRQARQGGPA